MLMAKVLGEDWHNLPPVIQRHYALKESEQNCAQGDMTVQYPNYLMPVVWLIHLFGGLVLWRGVTETKVYKTALGDGLRWQRYMDFKTHSDFFASTMHYVAPNELCEMVGFGFGLFLKVTVENGDLVYRSNGHFWQFRHWRLNIPDCYLLGSATIIERAVSNEAFYLDFTMHHPRWGESYRYCGMFRYSDD